LIGGILKYLKILKFHEILHSFFSERANEILFLRNWSRNKNWRMQEKKDKQQPPKLLRNSKRIQNTQREISRNNTRSIWTDGNKTKLPLLKAV
jgi:hypothetical protein